MKELEAGTIIYEGSQKPEELYLIVKGTVKVTYHGGSYFLRAGDVIGLCEMNYDTMYLQYQAEGNVSLLPYPNISGNLKELLEKNQDASRYFVSSLFRQLNEIFSRCQELRGETSQIWNYLKTSYEDYTMRCIKRNVSFNALPGYEELSKTEIKNRVPAWMKGYYATLEQMLVVWDSNKTDHDFIWGFLIKAGEDIRRIIVQCNQMKEYEEDLCRCFIDESGLDLFGLYVGLYMEEVEENGVASEGAMVLKTKINDLKNTLQKYGLVDEIIFKNRWEEFEKSTGEVEEPQKETTTANVDLKKLMEELAGSLDKILLYAKCDENTKAAFKKHLQEYKEVLNIGGADDDMRRIRRELSAVFYKVYNAAFKVSIETGEVTPIVEMFFNFGYVDEELAGIKNAVYMYYVVKNMPTSPERGVYSFYQWLLAVYRGQKEPGRNEFDLDYAEYLREQKRMGNISASEEAELINDPMAKVMYELENVFPVVNKVTYGRPSSFCPVFSSHNIIKPLNTVLATVDKVEKVISEIRQADYGAFYRETLFSEPDKGIPKEMIAVEVLPDVILTPNVGTRGIMWQEIEGKKRTTPARMMCSIFQMDDLSLVLMRLTAEFRWEMCKRIQGGRWNDVSEPSLTSEYFDYVQFYRKNKDLSTDAKEKIKVQLGKAKNSFKEMFIADYIMWVRYESIGSPRLNKISRGIMFTYCPFTSEVRERLIVNPLYKEYVDRHKIKAGQKVHHVDNVCQKLRNMGKPIPEEIENYRQFLMR